MKLGYGTGEASGTSLDACHFVVVRFNEKYGFTPDEADSFVFSLDGDMSHSIFGAAGWFTGLWRSESGRVFVSDSHRGVHVLDKPEPGPGPSRTDSLYGLLEGIWGLGDDLVFTWGVRRRVPVMHRFDGRRWTQIESPGRVVGMGGASPDLIYAVGHDGLIARWSGGGWVRQKSPVKGTLSSVFVAGEAEMYAAGPCQKLLQGSVHGWVEMLEAPWPLTAVAKWKGKVWVGAGDEGLFKLSRKKLELVKPNIHPDAFDARGELLISCANEIVGTKDGTDFEGVDASALGKQVSAWKPMWRRGSR